MDTGGCWNSAGGLGMLPQIPGGQPPTAWRSGNSLPWQRAEGHAALARRKAILGKWERPPCTKEGKNTALCREALKVRRGFKLIWNFTGSLHNENKTQLRCWLAHSGPGRARSAELWIAAAPWEDKQSHGDGDTRRMGKPR